MKVHHQVVPGTPNDTTQAMEVSERTSCREFQHGGDIGIVPYEVVVLFLYHIVDPAFREEFSEGAEQYGREDNIADGTKADD
jgi:hypothetical protein